MKKISITVLALIFASNLSSQEDIAEAQNFRFGLKMAPSVNWLKPDDTKKFKNGGSSLGFNWGLITEFRLNKLFSFSTGLELNHEKGKIDFTKQTFYSINESFEFIETEKNSAGYYVPTKFDTARDAVIELKSRKYSSTYVTLPIAIKMKTNEIGYMTYFGEFGLNLSFRTKTKVTDTPNKDGINSGITSLKQANYADLSKINYSSMQPIRMQLKVGFGTEYKISGQTAIVGAIHYNLGFTNVVRKNSKYLTTYDNPGVTSNMNQVTQKFTAHSIALTIGVLF